MNIEKIGNYKRMCTMYVKTLSKLKSVFIMVNESEAYKRMLRCGKIAPVYENCIF